jgi:hypothetical protein
VGDHLKIASCTCRSDYQDQQYGRGRRVHNQTKQQSPEPARSWRCTVCGKEK